MADTLLDALLAILAIFICFRMARLKGTVPELCRFGGLLFDVAAYLAAFGFVVGFGDNFEGVRTTLSLAGMETVRVVAGLSLSSAATLLLIGLTLPVPVRTAPVLSAVTARTAAKAGEAAKSPQTAVEANQLLNAFMEHAPCRITMRDLQGRFLIANKQYRMVHNIEGDIAGAHYKDFASTEEYEQQEWMTAEMLATGAAVTEIAELDRPTHCFIEQTIFPITDEKGEITALGRFGFDVTERLEAERRLAVRERELARIVEAVQNSKDATVIQSARGELLLINEASLRLRGLKRSQIGDQANFVDLVAPFDPEYAAMYREVIEPTLGKDGYWADNIVILDVQGREHNVEYRVSSLPTGDVIIAANDITERIEAERQLAQRERDLNRIVEALKHSKEGISILSPDRKVIFANDAAIGQRGLSRHQIESADDFIALAETIDPEHAKRFHETIAPALANQGHWEDEIVLQDAQGGEHIVDYRTSALPDGDILFFARDITEHRRATSALDRVNEQFKSVVENAGVGIALRDLSGTYLIANETYRRLLTTAEDIIVGKNPADLFAEDVARRILRRDRTVLEDRTMSTYEVDEFAAPDGRKRHLLVTSFPVLGEDGAPHGTGAIVQNVTDIRRNDLLLRTMMDALPAFTALYNRDGEMLFANRYLRDAVGLDEASFIGRTGAEAFPDFGTYPASERVRKVFETGEPVENAEIYLQALGRILLANFVPVVGPGGRVSEVLGCGFDITDRKISEAQLIQASKLATLGETTAGMVHELSQPLNIIRLAAEGTLLRLSRGRADLDYQKAQFVRIEDQASRMAEIMENIRVFSRKDTSNFERFAPDHSIAHAVELMSAQLSAQDIAFSNSTDGPDVTVVGRPVQLEQVILNLLGNARDAIRLRQEQAGTDSPHPGQIGIRTLADTDRATYSIVVQDNGSGISDDALGQLFEPFYTTKGPTSGTGLGLSVSYGIISSMGGEIQAANWSDGAEFRIVLPCQRTDTERKEVVGRSGADKTASTANQNRTILVVDDEALVLEALCENLRESGYRVFGASGATTAYDLFLREAPGLVITDVRMPVTDGWALVRRLRAHNAACPVIVATGNHQEFERVRSEFDPEKTMFVRKPVSLIELVSRIEELLGNSGEP